MFMQEWQDEKLISENLADVRNDGKGGTARNLLIGLFILIIMLSLTWHMIFKDYSIKEMKAILLQADWRWLLGGFTLMLIHQCCIALSIIRVMNYIAPTLQVKFKMAFNTSFIGFFFNNITPSSSGGQPMQMYYLKKLSIPMSYTSVVFIALAIFLQFIYVVLLCLRQFLPLGIFAGEFRLCFLFAAFRLSFVHCNYDFFIVVVLQS